MQLFVSLKKMHYQLEHLLNKFNVVRVWSAYSVSVIELTTYIIITPNL